MSMIPDIQQAAQTPAAIALLKAGTGPFRFYGFGQAPDNVGVPYGVWQVVGGNPENHLADRPNTDNWSIQVDVYGAPTAAGAASALSAAEALRDAVEGVAYITGWRVQPRDEATGRYRVSFDSSWIKTR